MKWFFTIEGSSRGDLLLSVILVAPFLLSTYILRYCVKDLSSDLSMRVLLLEVIAAAEISACVNELPAGPATEDVGSMATFILIWTALKWWMDTQWSIEAPNPIIRLEDMVLGYISIASLIIVIWLQISGAVAGYSAMHLLRERTLGSRRCVSPLKVPTWEGMLYNCCGTLVCRLVANVFSIHCLNHRFVNYVTEVIVILAGAKYTGGYTNPLPVSGMYYSCQDMMPMHSFLLVYYVAAITACFMAILIAPSIRRTFAVGLGLIR